MKKKRNFKGCGKEGEGGEMEWDWDWGSQRAPGRGRRLSGREWERDGVGGGHWGERKREVDAMFALCGPGSGMCARRFSHL